jgi:hypothetical protein
MNIRVWVHGTRSAYQRGCRCGECRAANSEYLRNYVPKKEPVHGKVATYTRY